MATSDQHDQDKAPTTTLLRRYTIVAGHWDAFFDVWRQIVQVRRRHGFSVLLAMADQQESTFTWVIQHTGDLEAAMKRYYADPERVALEHVGDHVSAWTVREVEVIDPDQP